MHRSRSLLVTASVLVVLTVVAIGSSDVLRALLALVFLVALPGVALTSALFRGAAVRGSERLTLGLAGSLGFLILGGLVLYWTSPGLPAAGWVTLAFGVTVASALVLALRGSSQIRIPPLAGIPLGGVVLLVTAGLTVAGAFWVARSTAAELPSASFTQLWMLPVDDGPSGGLRLGVANHEHAPTRYRLELVIDGQTTEEWPEIALAPGDTWQRRVALTRDLPAETLIEARLYRPGSQLVYRQAVLRLGSVAG
ncbi:hypothetical protein BH20CHL6_BH20CHL6_06800 [soil metagenome]